MKPRSRSTSGDTSASKGDGHYRRLISALRSIKQKVALDPQSEKRCLCWSIVIIFVIIMIMTAIVVLIDWLQSQHKSGTTNAYLVETLPLGDFELSPVPGIRNTWEDLTELVDRATSSLEITAMYWNLNGTANHNMDEANLTAFGVARGRTLLQALYNAAHRGVTMRVLQNKADDPTKDAELRKLVAAYPKMVSVAYWDAKEWYGGGIMHQKIWIADKRRVYIGSANMDWLSLSQVKEMGVAVEDTNFAADTHNYFETWWRWAHEDANTNEEFSAKYQVKLKVPCWSKLAMTGKCVYPLTRPLHTYTINKPIPLEFGNMSGGAFLAGSPQEVLGYEENKPLPGNNLVREGFGDGVYMRVWDQDGIVQTIRDAQREVSLSVMDFMPSSRYAGGHGGEPLWWPSFWDAILHAVNSKRLTVRLLISKWAHTNSLIVPYLKALQRASSICQQVNSTFQPTCHGRLQIKLFQVPGWNETMDAGSARAKFPPYSRVNHAKYLVTDRRINVGTSNMMWGYFYQTAGASFNCDHPGLRSHLQMAFNRDWNSDYATTLDYF